MSSNKTQKITYLSGTRADFGLMVSTLHEIQSHPCLSLGIIASGMHLSERFGMTVREIEAEAFPIDARVSVDVDTDNAPTMAANIGHSIVGFVQALQTHRPDCLVLLGDRGEMLAGALAGIHLGIPVVHIHGGERSGTVDEPVRHAISKLANIHLVATNSSRDRLIRMGEESQSIYVVGAPGLDGIEEMATLNRNTLCAQIGFEPKRPIALLSYHPVLSEAEHAAEQALCLLESTLSSGFQVLALIPNADVGNSAISQVLNHAYRDGRIVLQTHLKRSEFVSWMAAVDVMIGNSSSGIIEAASFGTPVVNVGSRQNLRERNKNVIDVPVSAAEISAALEFSLKHGRYPKSNLYGDGHSGKRIVEILSTRDWRNLPLVKCNAF